jgi:hypothetical protein
MKNIFSSLFLCVIPLTMLSCAPPILEMLEPLNTPLRDEWLVKGYLVSEAMVNGQILALALDGTRYRTGVDNEMRFGLELPGNATYALYFVMPDYSVGKTDPNFAVLSFENGPDMGESQTLRLPAIVLDAELNLGLVDIKGNYAYPANNPAYLVDFDHDGIPDIADRDDQNDGLSDKKQKAALEEIAICKPTADKLGQEKNIEFANILPHLAKGARFGRCPKRQ